MVMLLVITEYKLYQSSLFNINSILSAVKQDLESILEKNPYQLTTLAHYIEDLRVHCIQSVLEEEDLAIKDDPSSPHEYDMMSNLDLYKITNISNNNGLLQNTSHISMKSSYTTKEELHQYVANSMKYSREHLCAKQPQASPLVGEAKHHIFANIINIDPNDSLTDFSLDNYQNSNMIIPDQYKYENFILTPTYFKILEKQVPLRFQGNAIKLIYKLQYDGASCTTLIEKSRGMNTGLLVIKDAGNGIFGGYLTESLKYTQRYYGSGESFVFSFSSITQAKIYPWSKLNSYFIHSDETHIGMGGGGSFAFYIDSDLNDGYSGDCKTYNSECLATTGDFQCYDVELWSFLNPIEMFNI